MKGDYQNSVVWGLAFARVVNRRVVNQRMAWLPI
jgi:hypothetical protein